MLVGKNGGGDVSLPSLVNGPGDVAGFMAARGKPVSAHTANAPAMVLFVPCFHSLPTLPAGPCLCPSPCVPSLRKVLA